MPEQFIKVKHCDAQSSSNAIPEVDKKQDSARLGSGTNISNSNSDICRICHCEADHNNPLLSPCYCAGSLKYVHQSCLQQWLAASDTRSCELCKFNFILHTKIKPIAEWRRLEMTSVERRRLLCAILFHFVAAICVIWSLFVLIDRATEEVQKGLIAWPFWTKLVVVAVGFTGGAVFMYIQCRQYLQLFSRWKAHNRIILVQNAPESACEKAMAIPPSPSFNVRLNPSPGARERSSQVVANVECNIPPRYTETLYNPLDSKLIYSHDRSTTEDDICSHIYTSTSSSFQKSDDLHSPQAVVKEHVSYENEKEVASLGANSFDALELNIQEVLALDIEHSARSSSYIAQSVKTEKNKRVFKSLPNLSASTENLLM